MAKVTHEFLEAALAIAGESGNARRLRLDGKPLEATQPFLDTCRAHHRTMTNALSALRLVAPDAVVRRAKPRTTPTTR
ncbi:hypothetical protein [Micropruina sp.]|uniref:hypothetical protein n=1 Tax=Micropruina sp. TaxID=2737536 RepID=UPI0039E668E5